MVSSAKPFLKKIKKSNFFNGSSFVESQAYLAFDEIGIGIINRIMKKQLQSKAQIFRLDNDSIALGFVLLYLGTCIWTSDTNFRHLFFKNLGLKQLHVCDMLFTNIDLLPQFEIFS